MVSMQQAREGKIEGFHFPFDFSTSLPPTAPFPDSSTSKLAK